MALARSGGGGFGLGGGGSLIKPIGFGGGGGMDFSNPSASYNTAYQNAANINQQLYSNWMQGANQISAGYGALSNQVLRRLRGSNRANLTDIANKYSALSGQMSQQMIDRGLGNTTIQQSMQRGVAQDRAHETTRSRNMYAQLQAQMQSQIGQAGLGAQQGLLGQMMQYVSAPYPDPGVYAQLAAMGGGGGGFPTSAGGYLPGASPAFAPTGGHIPQSLFAPTPSAYAGGGGGGGPSIFDLPSTYGGGIAAPPVSGPTYSPLGLGGAYAGQPEAVNYSNLGLGATYGG